MTPNPIYTSSDESSSDLVLRYVPYEKREAAVANVLGKRRGGGGGGGRGGGGGGVSSSGGRGGSTSSSGSSSGASSGGAGTKGFSPGSVSGGTSVYGTSAASGVRTPYTVSSGSFAGRSAGGGLRGDVYGGGSRAYGSGYPLVAGAAVGGGLYAGAAVASRGFPYVYWPLYYPAYPYYYGNRAYNDSASRPGGNMTLYVLQAPTGVDQTSNNFALYGDENSVASVFSAVQSACQVGPTLQPNFTDVNPNTTVQYYRASSFSLLLQNYSSGLPNITVDANGNSNQTVDQAPAPLPDSVNTTYLNCLNSTIGSNVPLLSDSSNAAGRSIAFDSTVVGFAPLLALLVVMVQMLHL